jgi:raffinose/stachyose/melibiose transport system substrate-binding protein
MLLIFFVFGVARADDIPQVSIWLDSGNGGTVANCQKEQVVDTFNADHPDIHVEAGMLANSWDAIRTSLAGGGGPDIITTPGPSFVYELAKAGYLLSLDDAATKFGWSDTFIPWALSLGKVNDKLYSLPAEIETLILYYNATLFKDKGWQPPKTLKELSDLADKIHEAGVIPFAHANAEWRPANEWFVGEFLNHAAGPQAVYEALTGKRSWDDPAFVDAMDMLNNFQQKGYFMGKLDRYYTATFAESHAALGDGTAAMNIEGTWFLADIDNYFGDKAGNKNDWGWVPVPSTNGDSIFTIGIGSTYSINAKAANLDASLQFLSYWFSPETQARLALKCGLNPAPVNIAPDLLKGLEPRHSAIIQALTQSANEGNYGYTTWTFWPPKSENYIIEDVEKMWSGDLTPKAFLEGLQKTFKDETAAGASMLIPERGAK